MRTMRRVGVLATAGLFLSAFIGGPAGADTPAAYTASAKGSALDVKVAGQGLTLGLSSAQGDSSPNAAAEGAAGLQGTTYYGQQKAAAGETKQEACVAAVPAPLSSILSLGLGCASASASVAGGFANATGTGTVGKLDVSLQTILDGQAKPATDAVQGVIEQVLTPICTGAPQLCPVTNTVDSVTDSLIETKTASATLGKSVSTITSNASLVTAATVADAASIQLIPSGVLDQVQLGAPVLDIQVAKAGAKVECDLLSGSATPTIDPNLVRVKIALPLFNAVPTEQIIRLLPAPLPEIGQATINKTSAEVVIAPGQSVTLFAGLPIETDIAVAAGRKVDNPDGTKSAISDGVKVHLAKGLQGGVLLDLAHAEATAGCKPAVIDTVPVTPPAQELPRTGGTPVIPMLGAGALLAAVVTRRTLLARSN